jgi:hypothetical protein
MNSVGDSEAALRRASEAEDALTRTLTQAQNDRQMFDAQRKSMSKLFGLLCVGDAVEGCVVVEQMERQRMELEEECARAQALVKEQTQKQKDILEENQALGEANSNLLAERLKLMDERDGALGKIAILTEQVSILSNDSTDERDKELAVAQNKIAMLSEQIASLNKDLSESEAARVQLQEEVRAYV